MHPHLVLAALWVAIAVVGQSTCCTANAAEPLNGKDLSGWKFKGDESKSHWTVGTARLADDPTQLKVEKGGSELINAQGQGVDVYTEDKWGDAVIEIEVMVPKGSNSGIYLMGEYEIQVFDSYGKEQIGGGDMGAVYGASPPKVNASKAPGEWQKYVIDFRAPKFDASGNKIENAKIIQIRLNDQVLHDNIEMKGPTPQGVTGKEAPEGPLMFQGDHGPVAYRNIKIMPVK